MVSLGFILATILSLSLITNARYTPRQICAPIGDHCLCGDPFARFLTQDSISHLKRSLGVDHITPRFQATQFRNIRIATTNCLYPRGATSVCSTAPCSFTCTTHCECPSDSQKVTALDGTSTCQSKDFNIINKRGEVDADVADFLPIKTIGLKRDELHKRAFGACPKKHTPCSLPTGQSRRGRLEKIGYDCIDTASNIESCGGCPFPESDQSQGIDCTDLPNVDIVSCVKSTCLIRSCRRGYSPSIDGSKCISLASNHLILQLP